MQPDEDGLRSSKHIPGSEQGREDAVGVIGTTSVSRLLLLGFPNTSLEQSYADRQSLQMRRQDILRSAGYLILHFGMCTAFRKEQSYPKGLVWSAFMPAWPLVLHCTWIVLNLQTRADRLRKWTVLARAGMRFQMLFYFFMALISFVPRFAVSNGSIAFLNVVFWCSEFPPYWLNMYLFHLPFRLHLLLETWVSVVYALYMPYICSLCGPEAKARYVSLSRVIGQIMTAPVSLDPSRAGVLPAEPDACLAVSLFLLVSLGFAPCLLLTANAEASSRIRFLERVQTGVADRVCLVHLHSSLFLFRLYVAVVALPGLSMLWIAAVYVFRIVGAQNAIASS